MANWTRATLLKRLAEVLAESDIPQGTASAATADLIEDPHAVLGEVLAAEVIERLKSEVVREAMKR